MASLRETLLASSEHVPFYEHVCTSLGFVRLTHPTARSPDRSSHNERWRSSLPTQAPKAIIGLSIFSHSGHFVKSRETKDCQRVMVSDMWCPTWLPPSLVLRLSDRVTRCVRVSLDSRMIILYINSNYYYMFYKIKYLLSCSSPGTRPTTCTTTTSWRSCSSRSARSARSVT